MDRALTPLDGERWKGPAIFRHLAFDMFGNRQDENSNMDGNHKMSSYERQQSPNGDLHVERALKEENEKLKNGLKESELNCQQFQQELEKLQRYIILLQQTHISEENGRAVETGFVSKEKKMREMIKSLTDKVTELEDIKLHLQNEVTSHIESNRSLKKELQELEGECRKQHDMMSKLKQNLEKAEQELDSQICNHKETVKTVKKLSKENAELVKELDDTIEADTKIKEQKNKLTKELDEKQAEFDRINQKWKNSQSIIDVLNGQISAKEDENKKLSDDMEKMKKEMESSCMKVQEKDIEIEKLMKELESLKNKHSTDMEKVRKEHEESKAKNQILKKEKSTLEHDLKEKEDELKTMEGKLKKTSEDAAIISKKIEELEEHLTEKKIKIRDLSDEIEYLKKDHSIKEKNINEQHKESKRQLNKEISTLKEKLKANMEENDKREIQLRDVELEKENISKVCEALETDGKEKDKTIRELKTLKEKNVKEIEELKTKLGEFSQIQKLITEEKSDLEKRLKHYEANVERKEEQLQQTQKEKERLLKECDLMQQQVTVNNETIQEMSEEQTKRENRYKSDKQEWEEQMAALEGEKLQLVEKLKGKEREIETLKSSIAEKEQENRKLEHLKEEHSTVIDEMNDRLGELEKLHQTLRNEKSEFQEILREKETHDHMKEMEMETLKSSLAQKEQEYWSLTNELWTHEKEKEDIRKQKEGLQKKFNTLQITCKMETAELHKYVTKTFMPAMADAARSTSEDETSNTIVEISDSPEIINFESDNSIASGISCIILDDRLIDIIADMIPAKAYESLGTVLGFPFPKLSHFEHDHPRDFEGKVKDMLRTWRNRAGEEGTTTKFVELLQDKFLCEKIDKENIMKAIVKYTRREQ